MYRKKGGPKAALFACQKVHKLALEAERAVVVKDNEVAFVHGLKAVAGVEREHREAHTEVGREQPVASQLLELLIIRPGVLYLLHKPIVR